MLTLTSVNHHNLGDHFIHLSIIIIAAVVYTRVYGLKAVKFFYFRFSSEVH